METRKIQKVGGSTYTVSVPKEWAQRQGLETGEPVTLSSHRDGSLIVRDTETDRNAFASISRSLDQASPARIERAIRNGYTAGFERIELVADDPLSETERRTAQDLTRRLVGTHLAESDPSEIVVRVLLDASAVSIPQSIEQVVSIVTSMQRSVAEGLTEGTAVVEQVRGRTSDVDRLVALIRRHYNRSLVSVEELDALGVDRVLLAQYDRVADRIRQLATTTIRLAETVDDAHTVAQADRLAEWLATFASAVERTTNTVLGEDNASPRADAGLDPDRLPTPAELLDDREPRPSRQRVLDFLRRLTDQLRTIADIGIQSGVQDDSIGAGGV